MQPVVMHTTNKCQSVVKSVIHSQRFRVSHLMMIILSCNVSCLNNNTLFGQLEYKYIIIHVFKVYFAH